MVNPDGGEIYMERDERLTEDSEVREGCNAWPLGVGAREKEAAVVYKEARVGGQCDLLGIIRTWRQMSMQESNIMQGM